MSDTKITRGDFLRQGSCLAACALAGGGLESLPACAGQGKPQSAAGVTLRPYQLLCLICALGESDGPPKDPKLRAVYEAVRQDPDLPIDHLVQCRRRLHLPGPGHQGRDAGRERLQPQARPGHPPDE